MNHKFRDQCDEVARLIQPTRTPMWLTEYVAYWANELAHEISRQDLLPTRAQTRTRLSKLVGAADAFDEALSEPTMRLFLAHVCGSDFEREIVTLRKSLLSIRSRIYMAFKAPLLSDGMGRTRRGRGKTPLPGAEKPEVLCAVIVAEAWKFVRQEYPGARSKGAAKAALALWAASAAAPRKGWGVNLSAWRPYFEGARHTRVAGQREECRRILSLLDAHWKSLGGGDLGGSKGVIFMP